MGVIRIMEFLSSDQAMVFKNNGDFFLKIQTNHLSTQTCKLSQLIWPQKNKIHKKTFPSSRSLVSERIINDKPNP